ncbi:50S ribosomal protein L32 [Deltaproteobacteria bacterium TL4]
MAVPRRRMSRSKRDSRRAHIKLSVPALSSCTNCQTLIRPHRVCSECGYYKGVQIIQLGEF